MEHERARQGKLRWGESTCRVLSLRRELGMLGETISRARRLYPRLDPDVNIKEEDGKTVAIFRSGMKIVHGGCKDSDSYDQYEGHEYTRIYFDELRQFEKEQYDQICTRARTDDPVLMPFVGIRSATNPAPNWVRDLFVKRAPKGRVVMRHKTVAPIGSPNAGKIGYETYFFLPATLYDNPNKAFVAEYEQTLLAKPVHIRNALLYGDWFSIIGGFYEGAWRRDLHVIRSFRIPGHWTRFRILDWGFKLGGCCTWWAVDEDENLICEREYNFKLKEDYVVAARIKEIEEGMGLWSHSLRRSRIPGYADHNLWEDRGSAAESKAEVMAKLGVHWRPVDKASKAKNAERFYKRLTDHNDGTTLPGIVFFEECQKTAECIPSIPVDENDEEQPGKTPTDHPHDTVLYACAVRARKGEEKGRDWYEDEEVDEESIDDREKTRGQYGYGVRYGN